MVDYYTKIVLTVIAGALVVLVAQNAIQKSNAQFGNPQKVQICDASDHCSFLSRIAESRDFGIAVIVEKSGH
jgi:hypothetical protein